MKRKLPTILILLVMVLVGAMYWVDLSYYTDPKTGFIVRGTVWMRFIILLLPIFMSMLGLRTVGPKAISVLRVRNKGLVVLFTLAGLMGLGYGVIMVLTSFVPLAPYSIIMGGLYVWYGIWMALAALQLLVQFAPSPTNSALLGVLAALPFCATTVYRIMVEPSSLYRIGPVVKAFSALCAMLWFGMLLRSLYIALPRKRVRWMYLFGVLTFLFATCLELPLAVFTYRNSGLATMQLLEAVTMGLFGIVAGCVSVSIAGQSEAPQLEIKEKRFA